MADVIKVENLKKNYGKLEAVKGITFSVKQGEVFGLLGENGAGKTTTLEIIEGLRRATAGKIMMLGDDISNGINDTTKEKIGVQLQSSAYYNFLTLEEILDLFGGFYRKKMSAKELLEMVDLYDKRSALVKNLSGGQRQRFSIVAALVNDPEIVFLDEPTTGLDPLARRKLWDIIVDIRGRGKTIVLTTHYMEEAEVLCDRVAIMEKGEILKLGETHKLIEGTKMPYKITFIVGKLDQKMYDKLSQLGEIENLAGKSNHFEMHLKTQANVNESIKLIQTQNPETMMVGKASLEDLFIELTGRTMSEEANV